MINKVIKIVVLTFIVALTGCASQTENKKNEEAIERKIEALIRQMTLEEK